MLATVNSCYDNAANKEDISFCIVSQAEEIEHPDLSHIDCPINYYRFHWSESKGLGWARNIAINNSDADFIMQIDSHSRFKENWYEGLLSMYGDMEKFWGNRIIVTEFPSGFDIIDGQDVFSDTTQTMKTMIEWDDDDRRFRIGDFWEEIENKVSGDEVFYIAGGFSFARSDIFKSIAPDPDIYFEDQISLSLMAYTRGIRMINVPRGYVYSNYSRDGRRLHWEDHPDWKDIDSISENKLQKLYHGKLSGQFGIESMDLYNRFIKLNNIEFTDEKKSGDRFEVVERYRL